MVKEVVTDKVRGLWCTPGHRQSYQYSRFPCLGITTLQASSFCSDCVLCVVWQLCGVMDDFLPELVIVSASLRPEHDRVTVTPEVSCHHYALRSPCFQG